MKAKVVPLLLLTWGCLANGQFLDNDYNQEAERGLIERLGKLYDRPRNSNSDSDDFGSFLRHALRDDRENRRNANEEIWKGRWMPDRPDDPAPPPKVFPKTEQSSLGLETLHGVQMGWKSPNCDDAKTNLTVDWNGSQGDYLCYQQKLIPNKVVYPMEYCEPIPKNYVALHKCMQETIEYLDEIPLYGSHRPLWPVYGEYNFLPKQRWLHSLEHGAIAMLYHPCANPLEIKRLKGLVTGCLRRHVITPYNMLPMDRPLALVAWGCRLTMSYTNPAVVTNFIQKHALKGPENIPRDGDFDEGLVRRAEDVSDFLDSNLCPSSAIA
ncbi:uncharacterized protein LOC117229769 [Megalopta genalis]|uniref:uncharacterized protein LOC117229769 n=1 Tax=Megalopta genalis TaxID=115081 RepID=UPI0014433B50|nr:uncharacterized protein LOC117229769 [Megalopta genalis]